MRGATVIAAAASALAACSGAPAAPPPVALLTAVHAGPAQVTFAFRSPPRRITARYVRTSQVVEAGSGLPVALAGKAFLVVHFVPASGVDLSGRTARLVYRGPRRLKPGVRGPVQEVVRIGDFEADLAWAIGLDRRRPVGVRRAGATVVVQVR